MFRSTTGFGLIHPNKGVVVPPIYTFLTQVGTLIKAEKFVKEANYYILAYYNYDGELVYRDGLTPEQLELLICDN